MSPKASYEEFYKPTRAMWNYVKDGIQSILGKIFKYSSVEMILG